MASSIGEIRNVAVEVNGDNDRVFGQGFGLDADGGWEDEGVHGLLDGVYVLELDEQNVLGAEDFRVEADVVLGEEHDAVQKVHP